MSWQMITWNGAVAPYDHADLELAQAIIAQAQSGEIPIMEAKAQLDTIHELKVAGAFLLDDR